MIPNCEQLGSSYYISNALPNLFSSMDIDYTYSGPGSYSNVGVYSTGFQLATSWTQTSVVSRLGGFCINGYRTYGFEIAGAQIGYNSVQNISVKVSYDCSVTVAIANGRC